MFSELSPVTFYPDPVVHYATIKTSFRTVNTDGDRQLACLGFLKTLRLPKNFRPNFINIRGR